MRKLSTLVALMAIIAPPLLGRAAAAGPTVPMFPVAVTLPVPGRALPSLAPGQISAAASSDCYRLPRATKDRPDERDGRLVHVIYLVPSDFRDEALDTRGILDCSARAQNEWFHEASGGLRWRFDTFETKVKRGGKLKKVEAMDVTFVRSKLAGASLASSVDVADELTDLGFFDPNKRYLSFVASEATSCGDAIYPIGAPTSAKAPVDGRGQRGGFGQAECPSNVGDPVRQYAPQGGAMQVRMQRWGNSLALRIPKSLAKDSGVDTGSVVDLRVVRGKLIATPIRLPLRGCHP